MTTRHGMMITNLVIGVVVLAALTVAIVAVTSMDPPGERGQKTGRRYVDEVRATAVVDLASVRWTEHLPPLAIDMESPAALAVSKNDLVHVIGDRLVIVEGNGKQILRSNQLEYDYCAIAFDGRGRIYAAADEHVDIFDVAGDSLRVVSTRKVPEEAVGLASLAVTPEGIFLADAMGCRIFRMPLEGGKEAACEVFASGFHVPSVMDLTADAEGNLVTVDPGRHKVQLRDVYGDVVRSFGKTGDDLADFHGCCNPAAIAVMKGDRIVTAEKGLASTRVKTYDRDGRLEGVVAGPDLFDFRPDGPLIILDVAVDSKGRILVLDPARKQVRIFVPKQGKTERGDGK